MLGGFNNNQINVKRDDPASNNKRTEDIMQIHDKTWQTQQQGRAYIGNQTGLGNNSIYGPYVNNKPGYRSKLEQANDMNNNINANSEIQRNSKMGDMMNKFGK